MPRALALLGSIVLLMGPLGAANIRTVDTDSDVTDAADGRTTLREAILAADAGDTIEFASSLFAGATPAMITLSAPLVVSKSLMLVGPGDAPGTQVPRLRLAAGGSHRLLHIQNQATVVAAGIWFRGDLAARGGGVSIDAGATVTFQACDFTDSQATGSGAGGAILNRGTLTLDQCLVQGNRAESGGGVASEGGTLKVVRSLIEGNTASGLGGGIFSSGATLLLESSTLSGNQGGTGGGVAFVASGGAPRAGTITVASFVGNRSDAQSGGLYVEGAAATVTVVGSLFAQNAIVNKSGASSLHDLGNTKSGKINSGDFNLFVKPGTTLSPWGPNDLIGVDPQVGALAYNGGRTRTHALGTGSPALNRVDPAFEGTLVKTDQRRFPRKSAGRADIGAFELGPQIYLGLLGDATITVPFGTPYVDPGVDFNGPAGAVLTTTVNEVAGAQINACCPGTYNIVYTATYGGYSTFVSRTVNVVESIDLRAPATVSRFIDLATSLASVNLASIVTVTGFPANATCTLNYSVAVAPLNYSQTGLTTLPTLFIGQTGVYEVTVRAFSQCGSEVGAVKFQLVIDPGNVVWPLAIDLDPKLLPVGSKFIGSIQQNIGRAGESRWYKFQGKPGSRLEVALTQLKANLDLVVYGDINTAYNERRGLINSTPNNQTLALLGAEFAPEAYAPEAYSPEAYAPEAYAPEAYAPEAYAPEAYAPEAYAPEAYAPEAYAPEAYAPEAYAPEAYAPEAYAPEAYAPEAYASAQQRSLIAFSASPGTVSEGVRFNTYSRTGEFYIRVRGQNGVYSPDALYTLTLTIQQDLCAGVNDLNVTPATVVSTVPGLPTSLIVWDSHRIGLGRPEATAAAEKTALGAALASFATAAKAVVLDVNSDARVRALNQQADLNPACPIAKNLVADAIRNLIQAYRKAAPTIADITLVGNDDVIPFFRTNDEALLASEANYFPPVQDATQSQSALRYGQILTQDRYGSSCQVVLATGPYDLPEVPTGRLVETAVEVTAYLNTYRSLFDGTVSTGGVLPTPKSAFVAGYDFLADSALSMRNDFAAGLGATGTVRSLIAPENAPPAFGWTADQLRSAFLGARHDLAYLAAHFSTGRLLAADYTTRFRAQEVATSTQDFTYALILSAGCHSGYSTVDPHALPLLTDQPDWAQAFSRKGAIWISGTGYQYGDTDFEEYTERLLLNVAQALRTAPTAAPVPVSIGQAIVDAKRKYLANTPLMRGIHEKTLLQVVLYGLPMVKLNLPGTRLIKPAGNGASDVGPVAGVPSGPGRALGLKTGTLSFKPTLTRENRTLDVVGTTNTVVASYFRGADGQVSIPGEPVRPLKSFNVSDPEGLGLVRGVGFRGGLYTDIADFLPFTGAPATESRGVHGSFSTSVFYPIQPWNLNQIGVLCDGNGFTALNTFPTQFLSSGLDPAKGILRKYDELEFTVFYCPAKTEAALANPPAINVVASMIKVDPVTKSPTGIAFAIDAAATAGAGVQEVWITYTYTGLPAGVQGRWTSLTLNAPANSAAGIGTWTGTLPVNGASAANLRFIVQAANGVGGVTASTNFGRYFVPGTSTLDGIGIVGTPATITFDPAPPAGGFYRATIPLLSARLVAGGAPLGNKLIQFRLGPAIKSVTTDSQGVAATDFLLNAQPGAYALEANFGGDGTYQNASAVTPFTVAKMPTTLSFPSDTVVTDVSRIIVTLKAQDGTPLKERTVVFILESGLSKTAVSEITDGAGQARVPAGTLLPAVAKPYEVKVSAYFASQVRLPDGSDAVLSDPLYVGSTATSSVRVSESLAFKDEQAWVNYGDTTARGATAGNTGVTKAEILGEIAGPTSTFGPNSILATGSTTVTARLRASLSGKVIADGLVSLRVQSAGNRTWRGSATLNGTRVELNVDWNNTGGTGSYHVWIYPPAGSGPLYQALPALLNCELVFGVGTGEKPAGGTSEVGGPTKPWTQQTGSSRVRSN